jgi:hypothetical protein
MPAGVSEATEVVYIFACVGVNETSSVALLTGLISLNKELQKEKFWEMK